MNTGRNGCGSGKGFRGWGSGKAGAYCCAPHVMAYNPPSSAVAAGHPYQFPTRDAAAHACHKGGYARLCNKAEATGFEACAAGWYADYKGYYMNTGRNGCGSGKGFSGWGAGNAGAYCC